MCIVQLIYTFQIISKIHVMLPCGLQLPSICNFPLHAHHKRHIHLHHRAIPSPCPIRLHTHPDAYSHSDIRRYWFYPLIVLTHPKPKEIELSHDIHIHHLRLPKLSGCVNRGRGRLALGNLSGCANIHRGRGCLARRKLPLDMVRQALHLQCPTLVKLVAEMQTIRLAHILKHVLRRIARIVSAASLQSQLTAIHPLRLRAHAHCPSGASPQYDISQLLIQCLQFSKMSVQRYKKNTEFPNILPTK